MKVRENIRNMVSEAQDGFASDVADALAEIRTFAAAVCQALGEISRQEAVDALKAHASDVFERRLR